MTAQPHEMVEVAPAPPADHTVSFEFANGLAIAVLLGTALVAGGVYSILWGAPTFGDLGEVLDHPILAVLGVSVASIVAHELLHAVGFHIVGGVPVSQIRFGVIWRAAAPYASTRAAVTASAYRWAAVLPGILLGLLPLVAGIALGSLLLAFYGLLMFAAAGGDFAALWGMRRVNGSELVRDSTNRVGCVSVGEAPASA
jgi:hypothetical protein